MNIRIKTAIALALTAVLLAPNLLTGTGGSSGAARHFVRLPLEAVASFSQLNLHPKLTLDYGSFQWLALNDADFAALSSSGVPFIYEPEAGKLGVSKFRFDPLVEGEPAFAAALRSQESGPALRLIQFVGPIMDHWLTALERRGITVLQYYPHYAYLVWATESQMAATEAHDFVRWHGPFHPAYRLGASLKPFTGLIQNVAITFYNDGNLAGTLAQITALGGRYLQHFPAQPDKRFYTAIFALDAGLLEQVARLNTVWVVEYSSPRPAFDDEMGSQITSGNYTGGVVSPGFFNWLADKKVTGAGIRWAHVDTGLNASHPDITGRAVAFVTYTGAPPANTDSDGHGSHTAGAIFGDPRSAQGGTGITDSGGFYWGAGMAPKAELVVQNALLGANWPPTGGWQQLSKDSVLNAAMGSSNSWYTGASGAQGYSAAARTHDIMVRDANFDTPTVAEPIIMVFSAGNAGPGASSITEPKEAKNLIAVGASINYRSGNINDILSYSSRGPALDGRLLPNVMAPGYQTASFNGTGTAKCGDYVTGDGAAFYNLCEGTSMACPFVSGAAALIADWWRQGFGTNPSPAMVKALLINGAADMAGGGGIGGYIPNNNQGWGRVNLNNVINNSVSNIYHDQDFVFSSTGQSKVYRLAVGNPAKPVKVSLVWSDAPGAVNANPALVNNLNLTVVNGGNTYLGNVFSNGWSATGGSYDNLNNIENVYLQAPSAGSLVVTIDAANIAGDGVPYNGVATDQDFALVCTNCTTQISATPWMPLLLLD